MKKLKLEPVAMREKKEMMVERKVKKAMRRKK